MHNKARVLTVQNKFVEIQPLISNACINCKQSGCSKPGYPFIAANSLNIALEPGMLVYFSAKKRHQALQALISLCIPLATAVVIWLLLKPLSEGLRAAGLLAGLFLSSALILFFNNRRKPSKSEITGIANESEQSAI